MTTLFLCGDVMTGRGIDQRLPHPGDPTLHERWVEDAREYARLADEANGPVPEPMGFTYPWGDALAELELAAPDARIVNLETTLTAGGEPWPGKGIHYRMHPANVGVLAALGVDCASLANNHVLDWGYGGLVETLETLERAGIRTAGAGRDRDAAEQPAIPAEPVGEGRVLVFGLGDRSSGIPGRWAAGPDRPGVAVLPERPARAVRAVAEQVHRHRREGDLVVASIHWGGNWDWGVPGEQRDLAHRLIDEAGVDLIHGHSSHHVKGIEVYREKLILYGCGDLLTDYEGIGGRKEYRAELSLLYLVTLEAESGRLAALEMVPMRLRRFRLNRASPEETRWLAELLNREGLGTGVERTGGNRLRLVWRRAR